MTAETLMTGLPGADLIHEGVADLAAGRTSVPACLAALAGPRLRRVGVLGEVPPAYAVDVELQLYRLLRRSGGDAYSRYNALLRQLISFEQALDRRTFGPRRKTATGEK